MNAWHKISLFVSTQKLDPVGKDLPSGIRQGRNFLELQDREKAPKADFPGCTADRFMTRCQFLSVITGKTIFLGFRDDLTVDLITTEAARMLSDAKTI
jgi:hypothetical protein